MAKCGSHVLTAALCHRSLHECCGATQKWCEKRRKPAPKIHQKIMISTLSGFFDDLILPRLNGVVSIASPVDLRNKPASKIHQKIMISTLSGFFDDLILRLAAIERRR